MDEVGAVAGRIASAFHELEIARWLVPDEARRRMILPAHFGLFVEHALRYGTVYTTEAFEGVAVWLPSNGVPEIPDFAERNSAACGDRVPYFDALGACFEQHHPIASHVYLQFLAVDPGMHGRGIGSSLLEVHHKVADDAGLPAYLEASSERSRRLYLRHGYTDLGDPLYPEGGCPPLYPMWRA